MSGMPGKEKKTLLESWIFCSCWKSNCDFFRTLKNQLFKELPHSVTIRTVAVHHCLSYQSSSGGVRGCACIDRKTMSSVLFRAQAMPRSIMNLNALAETTCPYSLIFYALNTPLKVLTNEKRGGLKVVALDRPPFKLFTLRFSNKSVQAPTSEMPKTTQRTLFLSFEINLKQRYCTSSPIFEKTVRIRIPS